MKILEVIRESKLRYVVELQIPITQSGARDVSGRETTFPICHVERLLHVYNCIVLCVSEESCSLHVSSNCHLSVDVSGTVTLINYLCFIFEIRRDLKGQGPIVQRRKRRRRRRIDH